MIFVTVGTQKQSFQRIFKLIEHSTQLENETIIAQAGFTKYTSNKISIYEFMDFNHMKENIGKADIVICHGGAGSIFEALKMGKKVLAVPRLSKYGEHINDHQLELCHELNKLGYIKVYDETRLFDDILKELKNEELKEYKTDESFLEILSKEI